MSRLSIYKTALLIIILLSIRTNAQWTNIDIINDIRPAPSLFYKDGIIYVGSDNRIYSSNDNGVSWKESAVISPDVDFINALIKHENKIFVGTYNFGVFYTTDEGVTWNSLNTGLFGAGSHTISDFAIRGSNLFAGTYGSGIFVMDLNNLSAWNSFSSGLSFNLSYNINSLKNINGILYAGAGGNSSYFKNSGNSDVWEEVVFGEMWGEPNSMYDIIILNNEYIITASYGIYKSKDEKNWNYYNTGAGLINASNFEMHNNKIYIHSTKGTGRTFWFTSSDFAGTWNFLGDQRGVDVMDILIVDNKLFAGKVYGFSFLPLEPTSVEEGEMPLQFELNQNYPNPFNPTTTINFSVRAPQKVELKVYDLLGKEIATLINDFKPAGVYTYNFNAADYKLTSGVYFYKLSAGGFTSIKKMVLMK